MENFRLDFEKPVLISMQQLGKEHHTVSPTRFYLLYLHILNIAIYTIPQIYLGSWTTRKWHSLLPIKLEPSKPDNRPDFLGGCWRH